METGNKPFKMNYLNTHNSKCCVRSKRDEQIVLVGVFSGRFSLKHIFNLEYVDCEIFREQLFSKKKKGNRCKCLRGETAGCV